jgi:hypothetical protein
VPPDHDQAGGTHLTLPVAVLHATHRAQPAGPRRWGAAGVLIGDRDELSLRPSNAP